MSPADLADALRSLGWPQRHLARALGCNEALVRRWASGAAPVPPPIARWLSRLAAAIERHPAPDDWRSASSR